MVDRVAKAAPRAAAPAHCETWHGYDWRRLATKTLAKGAWITRHGYGWLLPRVANGCYLLTDVATSYGRV